jgi:prolyl oligopeptidase
LIRTPQENRITRLGKPFARTRRPRPCEEFPMTSVAKRGFSAALVFLAAGAAVAGPGDTPPKPSPSVALAASRNLADKEPPATMKRPVVDEYHGVKVTDDYRWLENWDDPSVKAWSEAQNAYARTVLDKLPQAAAVRERLTVLESGAGVAFQHLKWNEKAKVWFAQKVDPVKQQPLLVTLGDTGDNRSEKTLVDPNVLDRTGLTTIDWFVPSPDGKLVAVSLSTGGTESGDIHVYSVADAKEVGDVVPRAHGGTAGGSLAWASDSSGFYYTRYPRAGERPESDMDFWVQVYFHAMGTPTETDRYEVGKDFPKIAEIVLETSKDGNAVLASVQKGDGGEFMHFLKFGGDWQRITKWEDKVVQATLGDGVLYLVSRDHAPRGKVLRCELNDPRKITGNIIVPEDPSLSIATDFFANTGVTPVGTGFFVQYQAGGPSELRAFGADGKARGSIELPPVSSVNQVAEGPDGRAMVEVETFITPPAWYSLDASSLHPNPTALAQTTPAKLDGCEVVREFATSKDGTKVPISIIRPKSAASKIAAPGAKGDSPKLPTILWGYGGYGVSESPGFSPRRAVWLEQGGVFAIANIRGGGEFGEEWHLQGNLTKKQNVFDDFEAASRHLVGRYTDREHFGIMGGSNGGLLMGAAFTQHPELAKAVVSSVGIYDMLRVELSANGAFNVTEFGTVKDKDQFAALYAYSPYHHVKDGANYPDILFLTGANDPRVDPMQSRKMTARLQAAQGRNGTVLLRTSANAGHGVGSSLSERIEQNVDIYGFLFDRLGLQFGEKKSGHER